MLALGVPRARARAWAGVCLAIAGISACSEPGESRRTGAEPPLTSSSALLAPAPPPEGGLRQSPPIPLQVVRTRFEQRGLYRVYGDPAAGLVATAPSAALRALLRRSPQSASLDERFGVPSFLKVSLSASSEVASSSDPVTRARAALAETAPLYRMTRGSLAAARVAQVHDTGAGGIIVRFEQRHRGLPVWGVRQNVLLSRSGDVVAIGGRLSRHARDPAGEPEPAFSLTYRDAIRYALADLGVAVGSSGLTREASRAGFERFGLQEPAGDVQLRVPIRIKRAFQPLPSGLEPAYVVESFLRRGASPGASKRFLQIVSAETGRVFDRIPMEHHDSFVYRVWADDAGVPYGSPHGQMNIPNVGAEATPQPSTTITVEGKNGPGDPWLPAGATETEGNSVVVYDAASGERGQASGPGAFDWTYDHALGGYSNATQLNAAFTQAFVTLNTLHDLFYELGFDEQAGNGQKDNYGRGGEQGDPILVESQELALSGNAKISPALDGESPVLEAQLGPDPAGELTLVGIEPEAVAGAHPGFALAFPEKFDVTAELVQADDGEGTIDDGCQPLVGDVAGKIALVAYTPLSCDEDAVMKNVESAGAAGAVLAFLDEDYPMWSFLGPQNTTPAVFCGHSTGQALLAALATGTVTVRIVSQNTGNRPSVLDSSVVAHEYGHHLHVRLAGVLGSSQTRAVSEGLSDIVSLVTVTVREQDALVPGNEAFQGAYAVFPWVSYQPAGLRRYQYSTDMSINGLTFAHLGDKALPANATAFSASADHNGGELLAAAVWECYAALLNAHAFGEARGRMLAYLVASLKLHPADATFIEVRDALLMAIKAAGEAEDLERCWTGFAKRGMGSGAVPPLRYAQSFANVEESFDAAGELRFGGLEVSDDEGCDADGFLDAGERGSLQVGVTNGSGRAVSNVTVQVDLVDTTSGEPAKGLALDGGGSWSTPELGAFDAATAVFAVEVAGGVQDLSKVEVRLSATGDDGVVGQLAAPIVVHADRSEEGALTDDVDGDETWWTIAGTHAWERVAEGAGKRWHGVDPEEHSDFSLISPALMTHPTADFVVTLEHAFEFEFDGTYAYDGGVIEVSDDGGQTWRDVTELGADPGYSATLAGVHALEGRAGFGGTSEGYPELRALVLDFGTAIADREVHLRFRIASDADAGGAGWALDNVVVEGVVNAPFAELVAETEVCGAVEGDPELGPADDGPRAVDTDAPRTADPSEGTDPPATSDDGGGCQVRGSGGRGSAPWWLLLLAGFVALRGRRPGPRWR